MLGVSWGIISVVTLLAYGDGLGKALEAGFRGAFSDGTVGGLSRTNQPAGGRRARRPARAVEAGRRAGSRRAAAGEEHQPGVHAGSAGRLRQQAVQPYGSRRGRELRRDAQRDAAARRPLPRRRGRAAAAPRGVHRQRGRAEAVRRTAGRGRDDSPQGRAVRDHRRRDRQGADVELQPARQVLRVRPLDVDELAGRHPVRVELRVPVGVADARGQGDAAGPRVPGAALPLRRGGRARAQHLRLGAARGNFRRHRQRSSRGA